MMNCPTKIYNLVNKIRWNLKKSVLSSGESIRVSDLQPIILQYTDNPIMTGGFSLSGSNIIFQELDFKKEYPSHSFIVHPSVDIQKISLPEPIKEIVEKNKSEKKLMCFIFTNNNLHPYKRRAYYLKELLSICSTYTSNDFLDIPINMDWYYRLGKTSHKSDFPESYMSEKTPDKRCQKNDFECIFKECPQRALWLVAGELLLPFEARCKAIIENKETQTLADTAEIPYELVECLISEPYMNFSARMLKLDHEEIEKSFRSDVEVHHKYNDVATSSPINHINSLHPSLKLQ